MKLPLAIGICLFASLVSRADLSPSEGGGDDYAAITNAIAQTSEGGAVKLAEGTFHISNTITIDKGITLQGAGMNETVFVPTTTGFRAFYLNHKNAVIEGVQANGFTAGNGGVGFYLNKGKAVSCRATGNKANARSCNGVGFLINGSGGADCATNCVSDHNDNNSYKAVTGTGFYLYWGGKLWNCLAYDNSVIGESDYCAAIHIHRGGHVYNTTVVGTKNDGGIYMTESAGFVSNCVSVLNDNYPAHLYGPNAPDIGLADPAYTNYVKCCVAGRFAELRDPANGDYRLRPARAALTNAGYSPYDPTEDALDFAADDPHAFVGSNIVLRAVQTGTYAGKALTWEVKDSSNTTYPVTGTNPATVALPTQGRYTVTLTAAGGTPCVRENYLYVRNLTNELAVTGVADELPDAVDRMIDGETLVLGEGTYPTTRPVYMTNNVTIVGKGWDKTTVSKTGDRGVFILAAEKSHLTGCTVTGGKATDYYNITGSGVRITGRGGKLSWCRLTGNLHGAYYTDGLGVGMESWNSWVTHCLISNNLGRTTTDAGGGVRMLRGLLENSLIVDNTGKNGGGIYVGSGRGKIRNCTIAKNTVGSEGGGVCGYRPGSNYVFTDCVIAENTADSDTKDGKPNWGTTESTALFGDAAFDHCAIGTPAALVGDTSISVNAPFVNSAGDDFHLDMSCSAVEGGVEYEGLAEVDLDGNDRVSGETVDMGCYEADMSQTSCSFEVSPTVGFTSVPLTCTPTVINPPAGKTLGYTWTFTSGSGYTTVFYGASPSVAIAEGGVYTVKLEVYDVDEPETVIASNTRKNYVRLACKMVYAVAGGANPTMAEPFDTWEKAHTNLNELEEYLIGGCEVMLGEGEFLVTNHLVLSKSVQYHGKGMDKTVIRCSGCRGFYLNDPDALVENLTVTNGSCRPFVIAGDNGYNEPGCSILIGVSGGTVRNCRATGGSHSSLYQMGSIASLSTDGIVSHCIIDHNTMTRGGNAYAGLYLTGGHVDNCLVYSNKSTAVAGLATAGQNGKTWISNCTFTANTATSSGSGGLRVIAAAHDPNYDIVNCIFAGNVGVFRETAADSGGQFDLNELDFSWGAGIYWDDPETAANKIKGVLKNCCFKLVDPTATLGTNCINADPRFADPAQLDFRLWYRSSGGRSPCVDAGAYAQGLLNAMDLDGKARVKRGLRGRGRVDIGCYESPYWPKGFLLFVK